MVYSPTLPAASLSMTLQLQDATGQSTLTNAELRKVYITWIMGVHCIVYFLGILKFTFKIASTVSNYFDAVLQVCV